MTFPIPSKMAPTTSNTATESIAPKRSLNESYSTSKKNGADSHAKRQKTSEVASKQFNFIYD